LELETFKRQETKVLRIHEEGIMKKHEKKTYGAADFQLVSQ
jgi:hypothetical protein